MKNIIYLHSHDTGRCIQPYGFPAETPHLMNLARGGTVFRQAYAAAPNCSPSRAALLTGTLPHVNGMVGLAHLGTNMRHPQRHLSQFLKGCGYETICCGFQHEATRADRETVLGYDSYLPKSVDGQPTQDVLDERTAQCAADTLLKADKDRPFFLNVGFHNTHRPFPEPPADINPDYLMPPPALYDHPQNREDTARFHAGLRTLDRCIGTVLEAIRESGAEEDTILFYTTDHGPAFPHMKSTLYDDGIGVSLIFQFPGNPRSGQVSDALVSHLDVFPTLCDLAGLEKPDWLEGVSLVPLLEGQSKTVREDLVAELNYHSSYEPIRCLRTERYKFIRRWEKDSKAVVPNHCDKGLSRDFLYNSGWLDTVPEEEELYDLFFDPRERKNRIADPAYQQIRQELSRRLQTHLQETRDPLLQGRVPTPDGYRYYENSSTLAPPNAPPRPFK